MNWREKQRKRRKTKHASLYLSVCSKYVHVKQQQPISTSLGHMLGPPVSPAWLLSTFSSFWLVHFASALAQELWFQIILCTPFYVLPLLVHFQLICRSHTQFLHEVKQVGASLIKMRDCWCHRCIYSAGADVYSFGTTRPNVAVQALVCILSETVLDCQANWGLTCGRTSFKAWGTSLVSRMW